MASSDAIENIEVNHGESVVKGAPNTGPQFTFLQPLVQRVRTPPVAPLPQQELDWRSGVVVRSPNWMGDCLIALPALYKLRRLLPPTKGLFVLCKHRLAPLWRSVSWVDKVVPFRGGRTAGASADAIRALNPGVALVLPNSFGAAFDLWNLGIPLRVGRSGRWRRMMLTHTLPPLWHTMHPGLCHQLSESLELVSLFGEVAWDAECPPLQVPVSPAVLAKFGLPPPEEAEAKPLLALAPGAAFGVAKQWSPAGFRAVARWWTEQGGIAVALGTKKEARTCAEVAEGNPACLNLAGRTSVRELMQVLASCRLAAANDSGILHLASALGVPGVGIYGCTDPVGTGPLGGNWVVLMEKLGCAPCFQRTCQLTAADCLGLRQIPAALVCEALEFVLKNTPARRTEDSP